MSNLSNSFLHFFDTSVHLLFKYQDFSCSMKATDRQADRPFRQGGSTMLDSSAKVAHEFKPSLLRQCFLHFLHPLSFRSHKPHTLAEVYILMLMQTTLPGPTSKMNSRGFIDREWACSNHLCLPKSDPSCPLSGRAPDVVTTTPIANAVVNQGILSHNQG